MNTATPSLGATPTSAYEKVKQTLETLSKTLLWVKLSAEIGMSSASEALDRAKLTGGFVIDLGQLACAPFDSKGHLAAFKVLMDLAANISFKSNEAGSWIEAEQEEGTPVASTLSCVGLEESNASKEDLLKYRYVLTSEPSLNDLGHALAFVEELDLFLYDWEEFLTKERMLDVVQLYDLYMHDQAGSGAQTEEGARLQFHEQYNDNVGAQLNRA